MIPELQQLSESTSWEEIRSGFGRFLGVDAPLTDAVIRRAMADDRFAHYLLITRGQPATMRMLLEDPSNAQYAGPDASSASDPALVDVDPTPQTSQGSVALIAKATGAFARWARQGFTRVEPEEFDRRYAACQACPHLTDPSDAAVYKIAAPRDDRRICGACGCFVVWKARRTSERCPAADPSRPDVNRWGQELPAA
jgi:hypothetical protein